MTKLSIILPGYNEGETVPLLVDAYRKVLAGREDVELVFVDNGSTDDTAQRLKVEAEKEPSFPLTVVTVDVNQGYGHGILTGLRAAKGEYLAWSHADLQCPAEDALRLFDAVLSRPQPDKCFGKGWRTNDRGNMKIFPILHTFFSDMVLGHHLEEINAQPKLFHRTFLDEFRKPPMGYELDVYAYDKAVGLGREVVTVEVVFEERQAGESKWAYSAYSFVRFLIRSFGYLLILRLMRNRI